jgi:hypothetical protein
LGDELGEGFFRHCLPLLSLLVSVGVEERL